MRFNPEIHHRHSVRLRNYDYSQCGMYYVTICVQKWHCTQHPYIFGDVVNGQMCVNEISEIVRNEWLKTAKLRPNVTLHEFVVIPNHFHGILEITEQNDRNYVLKNDDTTHDVGARRALPDICASPNNNNAAINVGARRALPLRHCPHKKRGRARPAPTTAHIRRPYITTPV